MVGNIYDYPEYYDIAFSYRDIVKEVDFFDNLIKLHSNVAVTKVFEIASGTSPYLEEWDKRGYHYSGLDSNRKMLSYSKNKAAKNGIRIKLFKRDLNTFQINNLTVDFAYILLGSLYVSSDKDLFNHLNSVCKLLKKGGLYILDEVVWLDTNSCNYQTWAVRKNDLMVLTEYKAKITDSLAQIQREWLKINIINKAHRITFENKIKYRYFFPQEFIQLIRSHAGFEFIKMYSNFNINEKITTKSRNIVVLRKL